MKITVKENQLEKIEGLYPEFPYVLHHVDLKDTKVPWHWHEELEINYVTAGELKLCTTGRTCSFYKGEAFFINTNVLCTITSRGSCIVDSHLFHPILLSGHFKSIYETKYIEPVLRNKKIDFLEIRGTSPGQRDIIKKLKRIACLQKAADTEFLTRNLFSEIWLLLLEEIRSSHTDELPVRSVSQERILTMLSFIQQNFQNRLSLEDIAQSACVSKRECLRCFQSCIHKTPFEFLLDYRIDMAKKLLRTTDTPIVDIAFRTGFLSGAYFGRIFKRSCGITPGDYRREAARRTSVT